MTEKAKKTLWGVFTVVLVVSMVLWIFLNPGPEHIKDTNGADNFALQQITEQDVVECKMGNRGGLTTAQSHWNIAGFDISDGTKYSCRKFTGIYQLHTATIFKGSDIHVYLADFQVNSGNFAFYVVLDGKIIGEVKPGEAGVSELIVENIEKTGTLEYIIAGESANFQFLAPLEW